LNVIKAIIIKKEIRARAPHPQMFGRSGACSPWPCTSPTVDNGVYRSTLLLKMKWQSRPRSRLKLVQIVDPTSNVCIIVLSTVNAINDTGTALNWIPGTENLCTYRAPAWFPVFLIFFKFCTRDTLSQKTDKIYDTGSKSDSYH